MVFSKSRLIQKSLIVFIGDPTVLETLGVNFRHAAGPIDPATPMPSDKILSPKLWLFASYLGVLFPHYVQILLLGLHGILCKVG